MDANETNENYEHFDMTNDISFLKVCTWFEQRLRDGVHFRAHFTRIQVLFYSTKKQQQQQQQPKTLRIRILRIVRLCVPIRIYLSKIFHHNGCKIEFEKNLHREIECRKLPPNQ